VEASEIIPAEEEDDGEYIEKGVSKEPTASTRALEEEENRDAQCIERIAHEFCEQMEIHRRRAENRRSLDLKHNCQVGTHTHGGVVIDRQVTQSILEVSVRMEWARVNEVSGMITTTSGLVPPLTDRSMMDTQDGTYVWEYSQEDCRDSIVQLYLGDIKVLSNSSSSYVGGLGQREGSGSWPDVDGILPALR
jgi:hypothetical protein